jgi:hypothetical protein
MIRLNADDTIYILKGVIWIINDENASFWRFEHQRNLEMF